MDRRCPWIVGALGALVALVCACSSSSGAPGGGGPSSDEVVERPAGATSDEGGAPDAGAPKGPCFVALVHGGGYDYTSGLSKSARDAVLAGRVAETIDPATWQMVGLDAGDYWRPPRDTRGFADAIREASGCDVRTIGYDSMGDFLAPMAIGAATAQLLSYVTEKKIGDRQLVIVGHSMGGLVGRYVLDNGEPGAPHYDDKTYGAIVRATSHLVTIATPHTGSPMADIAFDPKNAGTLGKVANDMGLGFAKNLTTKRLGVPAFAAQMGDAFRKRPVVTIATTSYSHMPEVDLGTRDMDQSLMMLGRVLEAQGFGENDGVVTATSGSGLFGQCGGGCVQGAPIPGALQAWFRVDLNHTQARLDVMEGDIVLVKGGRATAKLGTYIGAHLFDPVTGK